MERFNLFLPEPLPKTAILHVNISIFTFLGIGMPVMESDEDRFDEDSESADGGSRSM